MEPIKQNDLYQAEAASRDERPPYDPPTVTSYTDEELLEALGPAQAGGIYTGFVAP